MLKNGSVTIDADSKEIDVLFSIEGLDKCFDNNSITANFNAEYSSSSADLVTLTLEMTTTSKEFFDYCKSIPQPFGKFRAFLEPQSLYTNIKNGYGIFYAQNAKKYTFKL